MTDYQTPDRIIEERVAAKVDAEAFVVFLIGMRVNRPWKVHRWLPVVLAMGRMIRELSAAPDMGLKHVESWFGRTSIMVQYWSSFDALEAYATSKSAEHVPAWREFNSRIGSSGDVGIWHETYVVRPGSFECVYNNMPRFGLSRAFETVAAVGAYGRAPTRLAQGGREAA